MSATPISVEWIDKGREPKCVPDPNYPDFKMPITGFLIPLLQDKKVFICRADTVKKYYLMVDNGTSYHYHGQGLGGLAISASHQAKEGVKEKNINVMNDFYPFHGPAGRPGSENYLYADWHVGDFTDQD